MSNEILQSNKKNFLLDKIKKNFKTIVFILSVLLSVLILFFYLDIQKKKANLLVSEKFNEAKILIQSKKSESGKKILIDIIKEQNKFYSPLSLYYIIENKLDTKENILNFFKIIEKINKLDNDNKNLIKIKKALYVSNYNDKDMIKILEEVGKSNSSWSNYAINLIVQYYNQKGQEEKSRKYLNLLNNNIKNEL